VIRSFIVVLLVGAAHAAAQSPYTLTEFLREVEVSHPSLRSAAFEPELAQAEIRSALGRFDPTLDASVMYKDKDGADKLYTIDGKVELPLDMMFGPKVKAEYQRGLGFSVNPETSTSLPGQAALGVSLPLFQGIMTDARRNQLRRAELRPDLAQATYLQERNNVLRAAATRYWDWAEALSLVEVADSMVALAEQRADFVARRIKAGEAPAVDSIEIMQEVFRRRGERFRDIRVAEQAAVDLAAFLFTAEGLPRQIIGVPERPPVLADVIRLQQQVQGAGSRDTLAGKRPEVKRTDVLLSLTRVDLRLADEFLRPFVEFEAGLAAYDVSKASSLDYKVGLAVKQPLLFRTASAGAEMAEITVQRAQWQRVLVQRLTVADIEKAEVAVQRSLQQLREATIETSYAQQMLTAEMDRFRAGESALLTVNLRERFLAEAQRRLVSARSDCARSYVLWQWATASF
jgi:outer membrane protein TolC